MESFKGVIAHIGDLLVNLGVPEQQREIFALVVVYLFAILVVVVIIAAVLRAKRTRHPRESQPEDAGAEMSLARAEVTAADEPETSAFERLRAGLARTSSSLVGRVDALLHGAAVIDRELLEEIEEILITADIGVRTTGEIVAALEQRLGRDELKDAASVRSALQEEVRQRLREGVLSPDGEHTPYVVMVVGVNGVGKTTTIGKLAYRWKNEGRKVLLGAADTFRAAAADQLEIWSQRAGAELVRHAEGGDPGAVAYDAARAAVARQADVLIVDTAGRLHTKTNLMEELKKVQRVLAREIPGAPHAVLLVLDATTGQNAVNQARQFNEAVTVTAVALTKLDGTAKGGVVAAISSELDLPICLIGVGEQVSDLRPFSTEEFMGALFAPVESGE